MAHWSANLLLFHQFRVGAIINDILSENGRAEDGVDFLGIHILEFAIKNELIALRSQIDCCLLAQQNESKYIAILRSISRPVTKRD